MRRTRRTDIIFVWNWPFFLRLLLSCAAIRYVCNVLEMHDSLSNHQRHPLPFTAWRAASQSGKVLPDTTTTSWVQPLPGYLVDSSDLWEDRGASFPKWMIEYFRWHKEQRKMHEASPTLSSANNKYLYVTCLKEYHKCGGVADRLLSLPFFVKVAAATRRVLLIQWTKPAALEEFLVPPRHGIDWRVPRTGFDTLLQQAAIKAGTQDSILQYAIQSNVTVLQIKFQSHDHGSIYYNSNRDSLEEPDFDSIFHSIWRIFFTPAPALAEAIEETLRRAGLRPGAYTAAHLRALYTADHRAEDMIQMWTLNSIHCAVQIQPPSEQKWPVFFASDSIAAIRNAKLYGQTYAVDVVTREDASSDGANPLHIDKTRDWKHRPPSDFFAVFIDLYMMALSRCVTYGMGGYGRFASLMSGNASCSMVHMSATHVNACDPPKRRTRKSTKETEVARKILNVSSPLFLAPMKDHIVQSEEESQLQKMSLVGRLFPDNTHSRTSNLSEEFKNLPRWMKDYFVWHEAQRKLIKDSNWRQFKYLVMTCLHEDDRCGGASDRLRPLPFVVRVAAESKRVLLIVWERPAPLESFLLPPVGGVNWHTPDWIVPYIRTEGALATTVRRLVDVASGKDILVNSRVQAHDHGSDYYNRRGELTGDGTLSFRKHYRDCWFSFFTPVPTIAKKIEKEMERMELVPGQFAFVHLRALYGIEGDETKRHPAQIRNWTRNALNCASNLRPAGPFFFSSDSVQAKQMAVEYGIERKTKVVTINTTENPQHLDIYPTGKNPNPSLYYPLFVDLYVMSMGRCYTYNVGGFGKWANLISGRDFTCNIRHWTSGMDPANKTGCTWSGHESVTNGMQSTGAKTSRL
jgi:hypothetical protein